MFTIHFPQGQRILLSPFISRYLSFAVMMKIPLLSGIMKKTPPKFSIHPHPYPVGQLCRKDALAVQPSFTISSPVKWAALPLTPTPTGGWKKQWNTAGQAGSRAIIWCFVLMSATPCQHGVPHGSAWVRSDTGSERNQGEVGEDGIKTLLIWYGALPPLLCSHWSWQESTAGAPAPPQLFSCLASEKSLPSLPRHPAL